jgi:hypothetical protein
MSVSHEKGSLYELLLGLKDLHTPEIDERRRQWRGAPAADQDG